MGSVPISPKPHPAPTNPPPTPGPHNPPSSPADETLNALYSTPAVVNVQAAPLSVRTTLSDILSHLVNNWKSSIQSFLTVGMVTIAALLGTGKLSLKVSGTLFIVQAVIKAWIGLIQQD